MVYDLEHTACSSMQSPRLRHIQVGWKPSIVTVYTYRRHMQLMGSPVLCMYLVSAQHYSPVTAFIKAVPVSYRYCDLVMVSFTKLVHQIMLNNIIVSHILNACTNYTLSALSATISVLLALQPSVCHISYCSHTITKNTILANNSWVYVLPAWE